MKTIVQEMANCLLGIEEDGDKDGDAMILRSFNNAVAEKGRPKRPIASKSKKKRIGKRTKIEKVPQSSEDLADLYYSRMAGEEYGGNDSSSCLTLLDDPEDSELLKNVHSQMSMVSASQSEGFDTTMPTRTGSSTPSAAGSGGRDEISVDEIRELVMASVPKQIRDQIPEEIWKQIFGQKASSNVSERASRSGSVRNEMPETPDAKEIAASNLLIDEIPASTDDVDSIDDDGTIFACSGLRTDFTAPASNTAERVAFSKRQPSMAGTEISDLIQPTTITDEDDDSFGWATICPTLLPHAPGDMDIFDEKGDYPFSSKPRSTIKRNDLCKSENLKASPGRSKIHLPSSSSQTGKRGSVKFDHVEVRYYERIATDNPSVRSGPAIGIGWRFAKEGPHVDINEWELRKEGSTRKSSELVLARDARERILKEAGCTQKEIADMIRVTLKVRKQRKTTLNNLSLAGMEEAIEAAQKKMARMLTLGRENDLVKRNR